MITRSRAIRLASIVALVLSVFASAASAETLLMPKRDFLMGAAEVVWGVTTQADGTAFAIDYGDMTQTTGNVTDRSYIAFQHTYAGSGTFTVQLCVGAGASIPGCTGELATVEVNVYNSGLLTPADLRNLNINRAIASALRYLWTSQLNRAANFPAGVTTNWSDTAQGQFHGAYTALIVLAFENHGYRLTNNNNAPTGLYEKYIVRRGLNYLLNVLETVNLTVQASGDPCAGLGPAPCTGLMLAQEGSNFHQSYETGLAVLPFAGSGALSRTVAEIAGTGSAGFVVGKPYGEILQRMVDALAFGQLDTGVGEGGWYYNFNGSTSSDGSTVGWVLLALLDAEAAGASMPAFVRTQWAAAGNALASGLNNDGSFDYQSDGSPASNNSVNVAKTGVGLQGMFFAGRPLADADAQDALTYIDTRWNGTGVGESFRCLVHSLTNRGCGYGMFNVFKGLKLYGVTTLPSVNRPAGTIGDPDDWHADYQDWLVTNQTSPGLTTGGNWGSAGVANLVFSSQVQNEPGEAAMALLILAPVALVLPDPTLFSTVGLSPQTDTNPIGTSHTVTATAQAANGAPVSTANVEFRVLSGPNAGKTGSGVTNAQGQTTFTYSDTGGPAGGTDTIQAFIGQLGSNQVTKIWQAAVVGRCDVNNDTFVTMADLLLIRAANGQAASGPADPKDGNGDMSINVADFRYCQLRLSPVP